MWDLSLRTKLALDGGVAGIAGDVVVAVRAFVRVGVVYGLSLVAIMLPTSWRSRWDCRRWP